MTLYAFILGRKHLLSVAELTNTLEKKSNIVEILPEALIANLPASLAKPQDSLNKLGGTVKIAEIFFEATHQRCAAELRRSASVSEANSTNEECLDSIISNYLADKYRDLDSKLSYGLSVYNFSQKHEVILKKLLINIKKRLRKENIKSRFINKNFSNPKTAAIIGEKLIKDGSEIVIIKGNHKIYIGETRAIQDIASYSQRDYDRPARDPKLGMLPPKLAQIMINLGGPTDPNGAIYDPFCGLGTVLTEGLLLNHSVVGSDISPEIIQKAEENINWLQTKYKNTNPFRLFPKDATTISKKDLPEEIDLVVTESYLGPPLKQVPDEKQINKTFRYLDELLYRFFRALHPILKPGTSVIISIPVYRDKKQFHFITTMPEKAINLGYKVEPLIPHQVAAKFGLRIHKRESLIYDRPDQIVGREIWKFIRN